MKKIAISLALLIGIVACRKPSSVDDEAINVLRSQDLSHSQFGPDFWLEQQKHNTPLWQRANAWCGQPEQRTVANCQLLRRIPQAAGMQNFFAAPIPTPRPERPETFGLIPPPSPKDSPAKP
jgi:hypothetical protein